MTMIIDVKIPGPGESITEVELAGWLVSDGDFVEKDQELAEVESEKATLPLLAPEQGKIRILIEANTTVPVGSVACTIDTSAKGKAKRAKAPDESPAAPTPSEKPSTVPETTVHAPLPSDKVKATPLAKKMMEEHGLTVNDILEGLKHITSKEVDLVIQSRQQEKETTIPSPSEDKTRTTERKKMSQLRKKLSERLVAVKNQTAMLTTFNEADMSEVIRLRQTYQDEFIKKYGVRLGLMSFFTRAATEALRLFPNVNAMIDGNELVYHHYCDIGIAVQTDKGLMVPVLRNTESMTMAEMEKAIAGLANKARSNRISIDDLAGGTFTITNGGLFGSMLSTPLLNPPQAAILGMHNIVNRPVAVEGKIEIRPVMYLALSYDHRIIDGKDSVSFLVKIKEFIEKPSTMIFGKAHPDRMLLGL